MIEVSKFPVVANYDWKVWKFWKISCSSNVNNAILKPKLKNQICQQTIS